MRGVMWNYRGKCVGFLGVNCDKYMDYNNCTDDIYNKYKHGQKILLVRIEERAALKNNKWLDKIFVYSFSLQKNIYLMGLFSWP